MNAVVKYDFGKKADKLYKKDQEIAAANARVKELQTERNELENELLAAMQDAGTTIVRGKTATVSISETIRPRIADFEKFAQFALRKKALHLFERRIASTAYKEMKESLGGKDIPGLSEFAQHRLNVRRA